MAKKHPNIYLIGPMGSGKTSVGLQLAKMLRFTFVDSDNDIEHQSGVSVSWIFEKEGESGFRKREQEAIATLTQQKQIVLATGGGCILNPSNREHLKASGTVIYLTVSLDEQLARTERRKGKRPLLMTDNPRKKLDQLNQLRDPLYREIATHIIQTTHQTPAQIAKSIIKKIAH